MGDMDELRSSLRNHRASNGEKPKKQRLTNEDKKDICKFALANPHTRQEDIADRYNVERSTISKILKVCILGSFITISDPFTSIKLTG